MAGTTDINALRYATLTDAPNAQTGFQNLAEDVDTRIIPRFASTGARDTAIPSPIQGMYCDVASVGLQRYNGSSWFTYSPSTTTYVQKQSNETVASSTALQDDNELTLAVVENSFYCFRLNLSVYANSSTPGIKCALTFPSGSMLMVYKFVGYDASTVTTTVGTIDASSPSQNFTFVMSGFSSRLVTIEGTLDTGATAGSLGLQWAQSVSDANDTYVNAGSFFRLDKLA